jgi:hypothetical protein
MTDVPSSKGSDPEAGYVSEEDSPEMKEMTQEVRGQGSSSLFLTPEGDARLGVPAQSPPLKSAEAMLEPNYTVAIVRPLLRSVC